jgi:hypothetical protein
MGYALVDNLRHAFDHAPKPSTKSSNAQRGPLDGLKVVSF